MPIAYHVDHDARVVVAACHGVLADGEVFDYQREVWSRKDVAGYSELIDMSRVTHIALPHIERVRELAKLSASMDTASSSKLAVVAAKDLDFGLGRLFQAYRELDSRSTKEVGIFRTMAQALAFLEIDHPLVAPDPSA